MKVVYFDCGIIKNIIHVKRLNKTQQFYKSFISSLDSDKEEFFFLFSPLLFLEIIGFKVKSLQGQLEEEAFKEMENYVDGKSNIYVAELFTGLKKLINERNLLTRKFLKDSLKNELSFRDEWGRGLLLKIFMKPFNSGLKLDEFYQPIVFELMQSFEYDEHLSEQEMIGLEIQLFRSFLEVNQILGMSTSFFRLAAKSLSRMTGKSSQKLREFEECVDAEIIHYALFGSEKRQVYIYSTEKIETWKERIKTGVAFTDFVNETIVPKYNEIYPESNMPEFRFIFGKVFQVSQTSGEIMENVLDVGDYVQELRQE